MTTTSTSTREQIILRATQLFQGRGYSGFSFKDIADPMGIKNAAVHYHFPSKADLGQAVIERYTDLLHSRTDDFMKNGGAALPRLEGYLCFHRHEVLNNHSVCPIGNAAIDLEHLPENIRVAAKKLSADVHAFLTKVLELGREQGEFRFEGDAADKAIVLQATLQGSGQLSRIAGAGIVDRVLGQIRKDLGI